MPARSSTRERARRSRAGTRQAILRATRSCLRGSGFAALTVDAVMAEVGLSRTAFYRYFDDLGALVQALLAETTMPLAHAAERLADGTSVPDERALRAALRAVVDVFAEHGPVLAATAAAAHEDEDVAAAVAKTHERFVTLTAAGLARGRTAVAVADPGQTARALTAMNEGYLLEAFGGASPRVGRAQAVAALWPPWHALLHGGG